MVTQRFNWHSVPLTPRKVTKPEAGHFAKAGVTPRYDVAELRTANVDSYSLGQEIGADVFAAGEIVDATGTSRGKGSAGVMKRHGFHGLGASHGVDRKHRMPGSIGNRTTPGRVFKGKKMMGRMGVETVTTQNLLVHSVDADKNLILIRALFQVQRIQQSLFAQLRRRLFQKLLIRRQVHKPWH